MMLVAPPNPDDPYLSGPLPPQRILNGDIITTPEQLYELVSWTPTPVVIDHTGSPWIVFETDDGDDYAVTVPCPDGNVPGRTDFDGLCDRGPLRVVFNGDTSAAAWPAANRQQEARP
jgi:hypothetical protein